MTIFENKWSKWSSFSFLSLLDPGSSLLFEHRTQTIHKPFCTEKYISACNIIVLCYCLRSTQSIDFSVFVVDNCFTVCRCLIKTFLDLYVLQTKQK